MEAIIQIPLTLGGLLLAGSLVQAVDPAFSDRTSEVGIDVVFDSEGGYSHPWYTGGGAVGDFDRDGFQDVFILDGNGRDYLYINNGDGTFTDRALAWGLGIFHKGKGASVGDVNGDGWLDIYVTSAGSIGNVGPCQHKLYRNNGNSTFTEVAAAAGVDCTTTSSQDGFGSTFGDYDLDGDLDLFVAGFASGNAGSRLFQNDGSGSFTDVTATSQLFDSTPSMSAFNPRLIDMDGDDYPDLPLAADFGTSRYFRNERDGTFTDVTLSANTGQEENGMGGAVGDFNNDGLLDWYVTSILLPAAGWTGNKLYLNQGDHNYVEVAESAGVHEGGYGWGVLAVDFNHDGRLDITETNGDNNNAGPYFEEQTYLWINDGDGTFTEMALEVGLIHEGKGRGMANLDFDNDGDQDVIIFGNEERVRFYRNDLSGAGTNWLRVLLNTDSAAGLAPGGTGARVRVTNGFATQLRYVASGDNFLSHSELSAHFGLGFADTIETLQIHWPGGGDVILQDVDVNQTLTLMAHDDPPVCAPAPAEVSGLLVGRTDSDLEFTWTDVAGADDYLVLADSSARGDFILLVGSAADGAVGVQAPIPSATRFFVVAGRDGTCIGP